MERLSFDTTFLIDLQRERRRKVLDKPAHDFLQERADSTFEIAAIVLGEFSEGLPANKRALIDAMLRSCEILPIDSEVALAYGKITRRLRGRGELVGSNDLWIAATSVRYGLPLVTRNARHFKRVPSLRVIEY